jgi:hypothetical protein
MHRKYSKDGFAAVSVSLDDPKDERLMANVRKFLTGQKATFTNVVLNEKPEVWQMKLKFEGPPCVFVFNRAGKWTKFEPFPEYAEVEKLVVEYLKKK